MKDYARFLTRKGVPVVRSQSRGHAPADSDVAPESAPPSKPRPFDRKPARKAGRNRTYGTHVSPEGGENQSPSLKDLASRNTKPNDVTAIPDSWGVADHLGVPPAPVKTKSSSPDVHDVEVKNRPGPKKKMKHKRRRVAMSISVSEEEEFILRTYAAKRNQSFSEWARTVMFRSMGRKIPDRS